MPEHDVLVIGAGTVAWLRVWHRPAFAAIGLPKRPVREVGSGVGWGLVIRLNVTQYAFVQS